MNFFLFAFLEIEFPSSLAAYERAYIHGLAAKLGLRSKTRGQVFVTKKKIKYIL